MVDTVCSPQRESSCRCRLWLWQIMIFAAERVSPALRGRQSCRTNDRSRPIARRTSSGRARGSRASNKPSCPRAPLLHRVPNERNRVDARALGREWFLESWPSGRAEEAYTVMSCEKIARRSFAWHQGVRLLGSLIVSHLDQSCFSRLPSAGSPAGSGRTAPAT